MIYRNISERRGFALLVTIVLVAFLVLILVGLATFTRVETQVAANAQNIAAARQNALTALNIAVGQLQRYAGPDQRVTATADIRPQSAADGSPNPAVVNRFYTGVWNSTPVDPMLPPTLDPSAPPGLTPSAPLAWLVSGSETATTPLPTTDYSASGELLVGPNSTGNATQYVYAPKVALTSSNVPGLPAGNTTIGRYAYWVGDEGVKARVDLNDKLAPRAAATGGTPTAFSPSLTQESQRLSAAQRFGADRITGLSSLNSTLGANISAADERVRLDRILAPAQLQFFSNGITGNTPRQLYHDITTYSRSVLSDTAFGGLRADLTYLFEQSTTGNFRTEMNKVLTGTDNIGATGFSNPTNTQIVPRGYAASNWTQGPTWYQLRSFYLSGRRTSDTPAGALNASGEAVVRAHRPDVQGIHPVLLHYRVRIGAQARLISSLPNSYRIEGVFAPLVVLANPYNVPIAPANYLVRTILSSGNDTLNLKGTAIPFWGRDKMDRVYFSIQGVGFAPGEARVFTLKADPTSAGWDAALGCYTWADSGRYPMVNDVPLDDCRVADTTSTITANDAELAAGVSANYTPNGEIFYHLFLDPGGSVNPGIDHLLQRWQVSINTFGNNVVSAPGVNIASVPRWPPATGDSIGASWACPLDYTPSGVTTTNANIYQATNWRSPLRGSWGFATNASGIRNLNPTPWLGNMIINPADSKTVFWGMRNRGSGPPLILNSDSGTATAPSPLTRSVFFDIPVPTRPVVSIGQLQHFNAFGFTTSSPTTVSPSLQDATLSNAPTYAIGNGQASPYVSRGKPIDDVIVSPQLGPNLVKDTSYILNRALWDTFYFSTIPQSGSFDFASTTDVLGNPRLIPFRSDLASNNITAYRADPFSAARNLLLDGGFNVNSTSLEAWRALLSSLNNIPFPGSSTSLTGAFARSLGQPDGSPTTTSGNNGVGSGAWSGYRNLSTGQIDQLAARVVEEVRLRGPFASLSDFVNRRLVSNSDPRARIGIRGALEAAIQASENTVTADDKANNLAGGRSAYSFYFSQPTSSNFGARVKDAAHNEISQVSGIPGILRQGDLLQALGPVLTSRSDTFIVRTYGEAVNPATGLPEGKAWLEAVVQRLPDYVDSTNDASIRPSLATSENQLFGRRFRVVSFRWLSPSDI